ncbi:DUF5337 domain-containing protein [Sulfitobacter delicatus]|jgi:hypothetical protein|uniref:Uncharacterized protein n=1 Tax=Sulfitobacter delicatus TaxID=218672 RepID=A0A1G7KUB2_9RHOB|nr:DUF5337 domain-containing protein [Sulfitobacter delicatus]SDF40803.1 hypothetical protein SAMN04489759_102130 [Sulfitobacter delicatus]
MSEAEDRALARKGRTAGLVIAVTMTLWVLVQMAAPAIGLPGRYALLFDFAALAALIWALVVIYQMWQARRASRENQR